VELNNSNGSPYLRTLPNISLESTSACVEVCVLYQVTVLGRLIQALDLI
jgi:hypothetical protein